MVRLYKVLGEEEGEGEEEEGEEGGKRASLALSLVARQGDEEVGPPSGYHPPTACLAP